MADSVSTPSSSLSNGGGSGNVSTPSRGPRGQEGPEEYYLAISTQPPSHVFPDEPFEVAFSLESYRASPTGSPPPNINIGLRLDAAQSAGLSLTVIEEPRLSLSRKTGRTKCSIQCSQTIGTNRVTGKLRLSGTGVVGCSTQAIALVRAKLHVTVGSDWTDVWYKDEGGRDKCIETIVSAYDTQNNLLHEAIELEIKLCYDANGTPAVSNQQILKRLGATDRGIQIDPGNGQARIRFRVEDVSKNHQGQNFVLRVSAAKSSGSAIGPVTTPPVNVRSKRNKRHRVAGRASLQDAPRVDSGASIPPSVARAYMSNDQVRDAVQDVIRWSDEVVNGMYHIQWRVMGYASNSDGTVDYTRPYHNMQNPNPVVERLLALYNQSTRDNIRYLQQAVVDSPSSLSEPYGVGGRGTATMPHPGMMPPSTGVARASPEMMAPSTPRMGYNMPGPHAGMPIHASDVYPESASARQQPPPPYQQPSLPPPHPHTEYYAHSPTAKTLPFPTEQARLDSSSLPTGSGGGGGDDTVTRLDRETEVEYVLARQYKSLRTGERLGFPAYSIECEILGFYHDSSRNSAGIRQFIPASDEDFGPSEKLQAKKILTDAINTHSRAVHSVKECGSIASVLDRCLVYDFSKDIGGGGGK